MQSQKKSGVKTVYRRRAQVQSKPSYTRRPRYVSGRGAYYLKGTGNISGSLPGVGKFQGNLLGGVGSSESVLRGMGAYSIQNIKKNVLITPQIPSVRNPRREGATTIRHKEYIGPIVSSSTSGAFKIEKYVVNAGNRLCFPFLHKIATQFEQYVVDGLVFEFRSTSSDTNNSSLQLGSLYMSCNYDPNDPPFIGAREMMNSRGAAQCKISENNMYFLECDPKQRATDLLYVRTDSDSSKTNDARLSDHGVFYIASSGIGGTSQQLGELYVSYQISLFYPKLGSIPSGDAPYWHIFQDAGISSGAPFGTLNTLEYDGLNNLPITPVGVANGLLIDLPVSPDTRTYSVDVLAYMDSSTADAYYIDTLTNCTIVEYFDDETKTYMRMPQSATAGQTRTYMKYIVSTDGINLQASFAVRCASVGTNPKVDLVITELPYMDPALY